MAKDLCCPVCKAPVTRKGSSPNGGFIYVAEDMDCSTECYDGDIEEFQCTQNKRHIFYLSIQ